MIRLKHSQLQVMQNEMCITNHGFQLTKKMTEITVSISYGTYNI